MFRIMHRSLKVVTVAALAAAVAACSSGGGTMPMVSHGNPVTQSVARYGANVPGGTNPTRPHLMLPFGMSSNPRPENSSDNLTYHGGPVQVHAKIYVVFWGFGKSGADPSGERKYLESFYKGLGGSSWLETVHQYYQITNGKKIHIINKTGEYITEWVDDSAVPTSPSDAQVQAEAQRLADHVKVTDTDASYVVATPHDHNSPGFGTQFCAYHEDFSGTKGIIAYTNLPYMTDAGANCGENIVNKGKRGKLDGASIVAGHELAETQTDPQPFSGWVGPLSEIGDACAWQDLLDTKLSTGEFATQPLWSNKIGGCAQKTPK